MSSPNRKSRSRKTDIAWSVASKASGIAGAVAARKLLQSVWTVVSDSEHEPPLNPADRRIDWGSALRWGIAAGAGAGIARVVSQRLAATGWEAATGSPPPGIRTG